MPKEGVKLNSEIHIATTFPIYSHKNVNIIKAAQKKKEKKTATRRRSNSKSPSTYCGIGTRHRCFLEGTRMPV